MKSFFAKFNKTTVLKCIASVVLICVALWSFGPVAKHYSQPETYDRTIQSIDSKKIAVLGVSGSAVAASTAVAAIVGDATTPIANEIMDIGGYLMFVVCMFVLEKSLLTILGAAAFKILLPIALVVGLIAVWFTKKGIGMLAVKIGMLAIVMVSVIPISMWLGDKIYDVNRHTVEMVDEDVMEISDNADTEEKSWWQKSMDKLKDTAVDIKETGKSIINRFIDAVAVFIIAYCAMPILVVLFMLWLVKLFFGITIPVPKLPRVSQYIGKLDEEDADEQPKKEMAEI